MADREKLIDELSDEVLSQLERQENRLLTWGFYGGTFEHIIEIEKVLSHLPTIKGIDLYNSIIPQPSPEEIFHNLYGRKLIFEITPGKSRTRFAETVRLLRTLKQRFKDDDWQSASDLVSDIKLELNYRSYPTRDRGWTKVVEELQLDQTSIGGRVIKSLIGEYELAGFQIEGIRRLYQGGTMANDVATIICAGTGAGKSNAFYIPALAALAEENEQNKKNKGCRMLAIYPRNELLKDQFQELINKLKVINQLLIGMGKKPIKVATLYGETLFNSRNNPKYNGKSTWKETSEGWECPYLRCSNQSCNSISMVWRHDVRTRNTANFCNEVLHCPTCGDEINAVMLTREHMEKNPPEILFTTTEMLNLQLSDDRKNRVFGVGSEAPRWVLLDETHLHAGIHGAHIAYLLRRWRHRVGQKNGARVHFVGLSATLPQPLEFFARLTGVSENNTTCIQPASKDLIQEGMEYNLVLRGNPMSMSALESTAIQTLMLMGRMLDPISVNVSRNAWGSKIYGFADSLDTVNRWHGNQRSAEYEFELSQYRSMNSLDKYVHHHFGREDKLTKDVQKQKLIKHWKNSGQLWDCAESVDPGCLQQPLVLDCVSSQNRGVNPNAKAIIATSTLEVGFDDPQVGAVIQYKAPLSMAGLQQRKGRAGRKRGMRPWTIVITSAYGKDRYAYDHPEQLFSPQLSSLSLPTQNQYVQRIHTTYAFLDWLGQKTRRNIIDTLIPKKTKGNTKKAEYNEVTYQMCLHLLDNLMSGDIKELEDYLINALKIDREELFHVLWSPPRSLMLEFIPRVYQVMSTNWKYHISGHQRKDGHPQKELERGMLGGFIPKSLFASLEMNGMDLQMPRGETQVMGLKQALDEFAIGNVSLRYESPLWVAPQGAVIQLEDNRYIAVEETGAHIGSGQEIPVFQPVELKLTTPENSVTSRSSGRWTWETEIISGDAPVVVLAPGEGLFSHMFYEISKHTTGSGGGAVFTRYAMECRSEIKRKNEPEPEVVYSRFSHGDREAAIGYRYQADALCIRLKIPNVRKMLDHVNWRVHRGYLVLDYYRYRLAAELINKDNSRITIFEIDWIGQVVTAGIVATALSMKVDIPSAITMFKSNPVKFAKRVLETMFLVGDDAVTDHKGQETEPLLKKKLLDYFSNPEFTEFVLDEANIISSNLEENDDFWNWMEERYPISVGRVIQSALGILAPDIDMNEIILDVEKNKVWFSEKEGGGIGLIERIAAILERRPGEFGRTVYRMLNACPRHILSNGLDAIVVTVNNDQEIEETIGKARQAETLEKQSESLRQLQQLLRKQGIVPTRSLMTSLVSKLLAANSGEDTDKLMYELRKMRESEQLRLGFHIPSRIFAVAAVRDETILVKLNGILSTVAPGMLVNENIRFRVVEELLWDDCIDHCPECVGGETINQKPEPSRLLLSSLFEEYGVSLNYEGTGDWLKRVIIELQINRHLQIGVSQENLKDCQKVLTELILSPVECEFEIFYPRIAEVRYEGNKWLIAVEVREVSNV